MKTLLTLLLTVMCITVSAQDIKPEQVKKDMKRVADWQIEHFRDCFSGHKKPHHIADWTNGALYVGMAKWAAMADDDTYYEWMKDVAEQQKWKLHKRQYHADDHTIGQMYCELYRKYDDKKMIEPTLKLFNYLMYHPSLSSMEWRTPYHQDR